MFDLSREPDLRLWRPVAPTPAPQPPRAAPHSAACVTPAAPTVQACHGGGEVGPGCFSIIVPGVPVAQPRARFAGMMKWSDKHGKMLPSARPYRDDKHPVHAHKRDILAAVQRSIPAGWDIARPCVVGCAYVFPMLKGRPRKYHRFRFPKISKPDSDNLKKAILDALKGTTWKDDAQVWADWNVKLQGAAHEEPHTVVVFDQRPAALRGAWVELIRPTIGTAAVADGASTR